MRDSALVTSELGLDGHRGCLWWCWGFPRAGRVEALCGGGARGVGVESGVLGGGGGVGGRDSVL